MKPVVGPGQLTRALVLSTALAAGVGERPAVGQTAGPSGEEPAAASGPPERVLIPSPNPQNGGRVWRERKSGTEFEVAGPKDAHRFEKERPPQVQRYRQARGDLPETGGAYALDGEFPGLNCTLLHIPGLHFCGTESRNAAPHSLGPGSSTRFARFRPG